MSTRVYNSTMIYDVLLVVVLGGIGLPRRARRRAQCAGGHAAGRRAAQRHDHQRHPYTLQNLIKSVILLIAIIDSVINPRDEQTAQQEQDIWGPEFQDPTTTNPWEDFDEIEAIPYGGDQLTCSPPPPSPMRRGSTIM